MAHLALASAAYEIDPEEVAFRALGFLADRPTLYRSFLALNHMTEAELLRFPIRREYFAAVLSFVANSERLLSEFTRQTELLREEIHQARRDLLPSKLCR